MLFAILMMQEKKKRSIYYVAPLLAIALFPIFWQAGSLPIYLWDEARLAINAAEMTGNGNLLVTHFRGEPEMWNTKPPLMIWLQAAFIKMLGFTEIAVRMPSLLAATATCFLIFFICRRLTGSVWSGIFSVFLLITTPGYMKDHVARTGDFDALLIFFVTSYVVCFFLFLEHEKKKYLYLSALALTLAVFTKGIAGLLVAPALLIYTIYKRKLGYIVGQKEIYISAFFFLVAIGSYYIAREAVNPGYLKAVMENELGGRYLSTLEGHNHPPTFYIDNFLKSKLIPWIFFFPFCVFVLLISGDKTIRSFTILALLFITVLLVIISTAQTKLDWYDAPVFPFIAIVTGLGLYMILQSLHYLYSIKRTQMFFCSALFLLFYFPYAGLLNRYLKEKSESYASRPDAYYGPAIKETLKKQPELKEMIMFRENGYNGSLEFYMYGYNAEGLIISEAYPENIDNFVSSQVVITCDANLRKKLTEKYRTSLIYESHACGAFKILGKK
ncbi:MAG: hypothetical protein EOP51_19565 [Sphingobacteriales bacterium]|nr:MAG: hypothetical protein EOP51_19565 [Sphingobacteriales bacterium]